MNLLESIKNTFLKQPAEKILKPDLPLDKIRQDFSAEEAFYNNYAWFDGISSGYNFIDNIQRTAEQATKIDIYRNTAKIDTVSVALDTLVNEIIYSEDFKTPIILNCELDNKRLEDAVQEAFDKIIKLLNLNKNFFRFVRESYIDGQMNVLLDYEDKTKTGIKRILFLDPKYLTLDIKENVYKYVDFLANNSRYFNRFISNNSDTVMTFKTEEVVHQDFGFYTEDGLILSELEKTIKVANQLKTLEDLLIPLRFSRSVSRRVFNVDVSDLPNSKAESFLRKMANTFKYRKEYNTQTGEIKNQQHMTSMVEDYWAASRGGQKGIAVDVLNETGDLGQLDDLNYYRKKLYQSMGVPQNRILDQEDSNASVFDLQADQVTNEDMQFFQKIRRIRQTYAEFIKMILKRELVATRVFSESQFDEVKDQIDIVFPSENQFLERMSVTLFMKKIDAFNSARELGGKVLPVKLLYKVLFGYTDDEVDDLLKEIEKESKDPLLKTFYQSEDEFGSGDSDSSSGFGNPKKPEPENDDSENQNDDENDDENQDGNQNDDENQDDEEEEK